MSRCAHAQSTYRLRKLPRCSKCKIQFVLVLSSYENKPEPIYEWECPKCHKVVEEHKLKEEDPNEFEKFLMEKHGNNERKFKQNNNKRGRNRKRTVRGYNKDKAA